MLVARQFTNRFTDAPKDSAFRPVAGQSQVLTFDSKWSTSSKKGLVFPMSVGVKKPMAEALMQAVDKGLRVYLDHGVGGLADPKFVCHSYQDIREGYVAGYSKTEGGPYMPVLLHNARSVNAERLPLSTITLVVLLGKEELLWMHPDYRPAFNWRQATLNPTDGGLVNVVAPDREGRMTTVVTLAAKDQAERWLTRRRKYECELPDPNNTWAWKA